MSYEEFRRKYRALMKDDEDLSPTRRRDGETCRRVQKLPGWLASTGLPQATGKALTIVGCGSFRRVDKITRKNRRKCNPGLERWRTWTIVRVVKMV